MPKPLIIGVDVRDLRLARTGTRTYLEELVKEFKKMNDTGIHFHFLDTFLSVYTGENKLFKWIEHFRYQLWKQVILPIKAYRKDCDIVFCTDNFVPLIHLGYKTIPVFHDAFFFENPEHYGKLWLELYKKTAIPAARRSPFVITPTQYAKDQIARHTGIPRNQLAVVYEGPKSFEDDLPVQNIKAIPADCRYLLHVGSMFKRKNIPALIYAFKKLKNTGYNDLKLVLAGPHAPKKFSDDGDLILKAIADSQLENEVIFTGYLTDAELATVYKNALMYVFPSLNEGFGIPILEAFRYKLPVLAANNTCLPEVGGNAVLQFDPFDPQDISDKIKMVLDNRELRLDLIQKGTQRLWYFSWKKTAEELVLLFRKAI
nr:glycosyltransferase family 1 protein [Pedobacter panaciterrae]